MIKKEIKTGIKVFIVMTILIGVIYPAVVTALAQFIFPKQASGSIIYKPDGTPVGSELIGQPFTGQGYFWPRPSPTPGFPYNSGLDPDIGLQSALGQVMRIAQARHLPEAMVYGLVIKYTVGDSYIPLTVPRVNVLKLNLALDKLQ